MTATRATAVIDREGLAAPATALAAEGRTVVGPTVRDGAIALDVLDSAEQLPSDWGVDRSQRLPVGPRARGAGAALHCPALPPRRPPPPHRLTRPLRDQRPLAVPSGGGGDPYDGAVCRNPYRSILVGAVEVVYAVTEALRIIETYEPPSPPCVEVPPAADTGHGATEAPRELLNHRYALTADGTATDALLVPPTVKNQGAIEEDLRRTVTLAITTGDPTDAERTYLCERTIRYHDPCRRDTAIKIAP
ncbi:hypothetical protein GCM10018785_34820 [Streptomyces longispororuber]|uniref:Uncharacterized protein n=1 Tax=Streptomyces longispororuber TaxID=68230 RepID=A0A918ZNQ5_9ACTN|nr:hypothetical protein GCM10018785_34820 [Streptomyces longispororuber]